MAKVIMGVGIPGSGKTTALASFAEKNKYTYICPDDIRAEITGDASHQSRNREVWQEAYRRVAQALQRGETVVFDATFAKREDRTRFIQFSRTHGAEKVQGVFTNVAPEIAIERNSKRDRVVPEHVIGRMHAALTEHPPIVEDGFDSVFDIDELQQLQRAEMRLGDKIESRDFLLRNR